MDGVRKKLAVIDGKSIFYRGYYAMPNLSTKDGTPTGGVYGFTAMALELIKKLQPDYVCVAWDKPKTNIRKRLEIYPEYKAGRKPAPPDFYEQIPILYEVLDAFSWPLYELDDYEADDIMHTLSLKAAKAGLETMLITSDLDSLQSVSQSTHVYALKKGFSNIEKFDLAAFETKYGIEPEQFMDLKSLKGDSSDNIPGVPGIGEKTALDLLRQYGTLESLYQNLALIKPAVAKKLEAGKDLAILSKKVIHLFDDVPVELDLEAMDVKDFDGEKLRAILQRLEFRSLLRNLPEGLQTSPPIAEEIATNNHSGLKTGEVVVINEDKKVALLEKLNTKEEIVVRTRSAQAHGRSPSIILLADKNTTYILDLRRIDAASTVKYLNRLERIIGYDVKNVQQVFLTLGVNLATVSHDVLIGEFLINSLSRAKSLDELAQNSLHLDTHVDDLDDQEFMAEAPKITALIRRLADQQSEQMSELTGLIKLAQNIEWPIIPVLAKMEWTGILLNSSYLDKMSEEFEGYISDIEQQIYGFADKEFNISSPSQLADVLFEDLKLPTAGIKKGKTAFSTAASELDKLRWSHPIINLITQYREYTKLKSTYVDTLPKLADENGRVHTTFNLTVAQTGRLSSTEPNLQNIPVRTEIGRKIREAFIAEKGNILVSADYSQFELRLAAAMAGDQELIELFNNDADIHTEIAAQVYDIQPHEVTPDQRRQAKVINFGILYGMSGHGLAVAAGMSEVEAREFLGKYKELRQPLFDYTAGLIEKAKKDGYVETLFGRRRPMPDINSSNFVVRSAAERAAMNMPIQGTEADLMKMAMIAVDKKLPEGAQQILQIHDSIMVECRESQKDEVEKILVETMESIYPELPVKLKVDAKSDKSWGDL